VVQIPWAFQISNTGFQKLSIVKYEISSGTKPDMMIYSGIDGGVVTPEGVAAKFPLTLEPGESKSFFLKVGVLLSPAVFKLISELEPEKRTTRQASLVAARAGTDLYGNKVEFVESGPSYSISVKSEHQNAPRFWLVLTSGRGNSFEISASAYDRP
jgi:hypothetical protein